VRSKEQGDEKLLIHRPRQNDVRLDASVVDVKPAASGGV